MNKKKRLTYILILCGAALWINGCMQSNEHIIINKDGSGTLETTVLLPDSSVKVMNNVVNNLAQSLQEKGQMTTQSAALLSPINSLVNQFFISEEEILSKAEKAGLKIEILDYKKEQKGQGISLHYKISFDDIAKLAASDIARMKFGISIDDSGNLALSLKSDPQKINESKRQLQQIQQLKTSEKFRQMPQQSQQELVNAMNNFQTKFSVTMPNIINGAYDPFEKTSGDTAQISVRGNLMEDPSLLAQLYEHASGSAKITCSATGLEFIPPAESAAAATTSEAPFAPMSLTSPYSSQPGQQTNPDAQGSVPTPPGQPKETPTSFSLQAPKFFQRTTYPLPQLSAPVQTGQSAQEDASATDAGVTLYLKNSKVVRGTLIEKTEKFVRVEVSGIPITYFNDQIERAEGPGME